MRACFQGFPEPPAGWTRCLLWVLCIFLGDLCPTRWGLICKQLVVWSCPEGQLQRRQASLDMVPGPRPCSCSMDKIALSIMPPNFLQGPPTKGAGNHPINSMHLREPVRQHRIPGAPCPRPKKGFTPGRGRVHSCASRRPRNPRVDKAMHCTLWVLMGGHIFQIHNGRQVCISAPICTHPC